MKDWISLADIITRNCDPPPLSDQELQAFAHLTAAIEHALQIAVNMPTTLDARSRALVVTKLQESEHWSLEILRVAARGTARSSPTS